MLELKISRPPIPSPVEWNYSELREQLGIALNDYKNKIYTPETIEIARKDRTNLNKLKKAINDERLKREREYLEPFNTFKGQTKEIIAMIDEVADDIGAKLDVFEVERVNQKRAEIKTLFDELNTFDWLTFDRVLEDKWLNKTTTLSRVKLELKEKLDKIDTDLDTLSTMEEYSFESISHYKKCLNITDAITEGQRIAELMRLKANVNVDIHESNESEIQAISSDTEAPRYTFKFEVNLNKEEALALANFCKSNNINIKRIK